MDRTDDHTCGLQSHVHPMSAEMALGGGSAVRVDVDGIVGAGLQAGLAADAEIRVELDDPTVAPVHRRRRADRHAGRPRAVIAASDLKVAPGLREDPLLDILDPGAVNAERDLVLRLTRGGARMTADALAVVDQEGVVHLASRES